MAVLLHKEATRRFIMILAVYDDDDDDGVFLFQEKHETQELYLVTSPRHAWG